MVHCLYAGSWKKGKFNPESLASDENFSNCFSFHNRFCDMDIGPLGTGLRLD